MHTQGSLHAHPNVRVIALLLALGIAASGQAENGPRVGSEVRVNAPQQSFPNDLPSRGTVTLAASEDGQRLLAGWDDFQGFCGPPINLSCTPEQPRGVSGFGFSTDGGLTWTDGGSPPPISGSETDGHPWADRSGESGGDGDHHGDDQGEVFYLASRLRSPVTGISTGIGVYRGRFVAGSFAWEQSQALAPPNFKDSYNRPAIGTTKHNGGAVYVGLINIKELCGFAGFGFGQVEVWRSHDSATTWQGPVIAGPDLAEVTDPANPQCGVVGTNQVNASLAVGTQGEVYVVWARGPRFLDLQGTTETGSAIAFARSLDGGQTFEPPQILVSINSMFHNPPVGYGKNRMPDHPRIAVASGGRHRGRIYLTFFQPVQPVNVPATQQSAVSSQIFLTTSDDQGKSWSAPVPLAAPVPATGIKRFWPTVHVRPGGAVDVIYLESLEAQAPDASSCDVAISGFRRRQGPLSSLVDTYWVQSRDSGATFGPRVRVSSQTSNWCKADYTFVNANFSNFGDYLGIAATRDSTLALWPDGRNGVSDVFFAEIRGKTAGETDDE
jgi:hypothetical protein